MDVSSNNTGTKIKIDILEKVPKIRIVFMGTPQFAAVILENLLRHHYHIVGVVTQPDKPVGRKQEIKSSAIKELSLRESLPLIQPTRLDDESIDAIKSWRPDMIVVAAYGRILPKKLLLIPGFGCVNVHGSILPRWRGASPIQNAILSGDTETGITIMRMDEGMDTGDIITTETTPIEPDEIKSELETRLSKIGSELLAHTLPRYVEQKITLKKQDDTSATLCQLIEREDGRIFWNAHSQAIYNRYRALSPWPGVFTFWKRGETLLRLKLITLSHLKQSPHIERTLGEIFEISDSIGVKTTTGVIILHQIQLEGKEPTDIRTFINGYRDFIGSILQ